MAKGTFIMYDIDLMSIQYLTNEQTGRLFRALLDYRTKGTVSDFEDDAALKIIFHQMVEHISLNEKKYKQMCEKKSESMKKRWNAGNHRSAYTSIEEGLVLGDTDTETDTDTVNDTVTVNDTETDTVPCGTKTENKRKNYYDKKNSVPSSLRGEPSYDADAFMRKAIGLKYQKPESRQ